MIEDGIGLLRKACLILRSLLGLGEFTCRILRGHCPILQKSLAQAAG